MGNDDAALILGLLIFFAIHLVPASPGLRAGLVDRFGATTYKAVFGVLSLIGLVLIVMGYHKLQVMPGKNLSFGIRRSGRATLRSC